MFDATPKPALHSSTVWSGIVQLAAAVAMMALGTFLPEHADLVPAGIVMLSTGVATIRGRLTATKPIGKPAA